MTLGLAFFFRNEELALEHMLSLLSPFVDEIVGVNDNSTDKSIEIVRSFNGRVYQSGLSDFASMRTIAAHLVRSEVVLMIDPDESLRWPERLPFLVDQCKSHQVDAFALPRRRWSNLEMTKEEESGAYPDWQVRLFRNDPSFVFLRPVHEYFSGGAVVHLPFNQLPEIAHFNLVFHQPELRKEREERYKKLVAKDSINKFISEFLQQQIQQCSCFSQPMQCKDCIEKRSFIRVIFNRNLTWDRAKAIISQFKISTTIEEIQKEFKLCQ